MQFNWLTLVWIDGWRSNRRDESAEQRSNRRGESAEQRLEAVEQQEPRISGAKVGGRGAAGASNRRRGRSSGGWMEAARCRIPGAAAALFSSPLSARVNNLHCIPPNPRRVGNIVAVHGPPDGPNTWAISATHIYTNK